MIKLPKLKTEDLRLKDLMFTYENSHGEIVALTNRQAAEIKMRAEAYEGLRAALEDLLDMTLVVDEATVPKAGIEAAPENQVVYNASISHSRIKRAKQALQEQEK